MIGAALLWVGWFGFNGGSQLAADGGAAMALTVTHISAATASLTWALWERIRYGKASLVGIVTGTIAGLASITPASGFVEPVEALVIGAVAGVLCQEAVRLVRNTLKIDDTLDVFAVHGVGGIFGRNRYIHPNGNGQGRKQAAPEKIVLIPNLRSTDGRR